MSRCRPVNERSLLSVLPKVLEPIRRQFGISNRVHDIFVAHVMLKGSSVMPVVGQLVPGGVAKHVRVDREWKFCGLSSADDHFQETRSRGRTTALGDEDVPRF
jgi:hypothetical protein